MPFALHQTVYLGPDISFIAESCVVVIADYRFIRSDKRNIAEVYR